MDFGNSQSLSSYIQHFGNWAPLVAFILFTVQAALPLFPYIILTAAGGILFGFKLGFLLSWLGALTGACVAYWMFRLMGYNRFLQRYYARFGYDLRQLDSSLAFWSIVIARILPVIPTPLINAASALGGVSFPTFLVSSAIGKLPTALLYTGLGLALFNAKNVHTALIIIGVALVVLLLIKYKARTLFPRNAA